MRKEIIVIIFITICGFLIACQSKKVEPITINLDTAIWYTSVSGLQDKDPRAMHSGSVKIIVKGKSNAKKVYFRQLGTGLLSYSKLRLDSLGQFYDTLYYSTTLNLKKDSFQCIGTLFATNDTTQTERDMHFTPFLEEDKKNSIQLNFKSPYLKYHY